MQSKEKTRGEIAIKDIKHIANSRFRDTEEVSDLMADIKLRGLMQPVGIRKEDNALIYGNRRVAACKKLGYDKVFCDFYENVSDAELMAMNINENKTQKSYTIIETGRGIYLMMQADKNKTILEVAALLTMPATKVTHILKTYEVVRGTPYEKYVVEGTKTEGIPVDFVQKCQTLLSRVRINRRLSERDWKILLEASKNRTLTLNDLYPLKKICRAKPNIQMELAIKLLDDCKVINVVLPVDLKIFNEEISKTKCSSEKEFIAHIIKQYNPNLLY
jgi:ParB/RepB/Spo0J family partition protein